MGIQIEDAPAGMAGPRAAVTVPAPHRLDLRDAHPFRVRLLDAIARAEVVTVDLSAVERLDACGAAVLVGAARRAARAGALLRMTGWSDRVAGDLAAHGLTRWLRHATV